MSELNTQQGSLICNVAVSLPNFVLLGVQTRKGDKVRPDWIVVVIVVVVLFFLEHVILNLDFVFSSLQSTELNFASNINA